MASLADAVLIFVVNLLIGAAAIYAGVRLVVDEEADYGYAVVTAAIGALVWAVVAFFVGWIPVVGPLLTLVAWIGVINWRYPGGWGTAAAIAVVAWLIAFVILYLLALFDVVSLQALGIPGA